MADSVQPASTAALNAVPITDQVKLLSYIVQKLESFDQQQQSFALSLQVVANREPVIQIFEFTASSVFSGSEQSTNQNSVQKYLQLLNALGITPPARDPTAAPFEMVHSKKKSPLFKWHWLDQQKEADAYPFLCQFLTANGFECKVVDNGQAQHKKCLFNAEIWTLRTRPDASGRAEKIMLKARVRGSTDIVCLNEKVIGTGIIVAHMVLFAIEVKRPKDVPSWTSFSNAIREATVQLLGLCAANEFCTPCVKLSDLVSKHCVVHLALPDPSICRYRIDVTCCKTFSDTLGLAKDIACRPCISKFFGRSATPPASEMAEVEFVDADSQDEDEVDFAPELNHRLSRRSRQAPGCRLCASAALHLT